MSSKNIVFFGNERLSSGFTPVGSPTLEALLDNNYRPVAVVTNYQPQTSRRPRSFGTEAVAQDQDLPVFNPRRLQDIETDLSKLKPAVGVLVAYGRLVPESVLRLFPYGIINIHPSLLPAYRGPTPIEQAILDGAPVTGVSLMQLVKDLDAGPLFAQDQLALTKQPYKLALTQQLLELGIKLLIEKLPAILNGRLKPTPQPATGASYTTKITKDMGQLDWFKPASLLAREVRAYESWPGSFADLAGQTVTVTKARAVVSTDATSTPGTVLSTAKSLAVQTAQGLLMIESLKPAGKAEMNGPDFVRGYLR